MPTNIHISIPQINVMPDHKIQFRAEISATMRLGMAEQKGTIKADFTNLTPWANLASEESLDLMILSFFAYGIDRFVQRKPFSVDGWSREITVSLPVVKLAKWKTQKQAVEKLLSFLTGDYWAVNFYKNTMDVLPIVALDSQYKVQFCQVNLFSGGMDSLIGAIDQLESSKNPVLFISHYDQKMGGPRGDQEKLIPVLQKKYPNRFIHIPAVNVFLDDVRIRETTCRSRSIVFIGMANLFADVLKVNVCVPENGTVSVNYPLSPSRRCACSTRTTHPTFIDEVAELFNALAITTKIYNPYKFSTKGEMANNCKNLTFFKAILALSNSCGKRGHRAHWDGPGTHCGICMPCIYRRSALLNIADGTSYGNNINKLNFTSKKGQDIGTMLDFLAELITDRDIKFELIANGLKDQDHLYDYIDLIKRTRNELTDWIRKTGNIAVRNKAGI